MTKESEYTKKRNFSKTKEPQESPNKAQDKTASKTSIFVIQKHDATNLHYDFRLEIDGTLKSWSVPKGPSTDPKIKRMAIPTEDHPMAYATFEGTIPKEEYGGGTVMAWDKGTFENIKTDDKGHPIDLSESYQMGTIEVNIKGHKIKGGYTMIKMESGNMKGNWLLIKMDDDAANTHSNPVNTENKSVLSHRTMNQIAEEEEEEEEIESRSKCL